MIYCSLVYLFLYCPIAVVIAFSFNDSAYSQLWHGFTWHWYTVLFHDHALFKVTWHSLLVAISSASLASMLGFIIATSLFRYQFLGKKLLYGLTFSLITMPNIVIAVALLLLYKQLSFPLGFWSLLLAHVSFCTPFVSIMVYNSLKQLDSALFETAQDLGANETTLLTKIILPLTRSAVIAGWLISFTLSIDDVIISYFVTGPGFEILPLKIYSLVRVGVKPEINALCTLLLIATIIIISFAQRISNNGKPS